MALSKHVTTLMLTTFNGYSDISEFRINCDPCRCSWFQLDFILLVIVPRNHLQKMKKCIGSVFVSSGLL